MKRIALFVATMPTRPAQRNRSAHNGTAVLKLEHPLCVARQK